MQENNNLAQQTYIPSDWLTINEAVKLARKKSGIKVKDSDIYRHALSHDIFLSIYFQSPVFLKEVMFCRGKIKLSTSCNPIRNDYFAACTKGKLLATPCPILDTRLLGCESSLVQNLLAHSLRISPPTRDTYAFNIGILVNIGGVDFQVFKKFPSLDTKISKLKTTSTCLYNSLNSVIYPHFSEENLLAYFTPVYALPSDACFVIKHHELNKLIKILSPQQGGVSTSSRISTPLSRMFWLACKNNAIISPLISKPYKLLSIFEQWASVEGITEHFSGDTLKNALERGAPSSASFTR
ncbi:hypothetical protein [Klebsiella aerogenes]|uniref:hypothetical protein n=1 Tax=Klebsiella aerogenes TaxID=548 RepID=UPI0027813B64|nr:hypothetical protein [Klebsiella pneumoniae]HDT0686812.1 hypothetical protein [Klebsiella aerogenes]